MTQSFDILKAIEALSLYRKRWFVEYISNNRCEVVSGKIKPALDFESIGVDVEATYLIAQNAAIVELVKIYKPN